MSKTKQFKKIHRMIGSLFVGGLIVSCLANHLFSIFEKKAVLILLGFLLCSPLLGWFFSILFSKFKKIFHELNGKRGLFFVSSLLLGLLSAILTYHAPVSYQTLSLQPQISQDQKVELLEIKVAGDVLSVDKEAVVSKWSQADGVTSATFDSESLVLTFQAPTNSQVNILFISSQQSGKVTLSLGSEKREIDLSSDAMQQELITFHSSYRGIPGWLFLSFLILSDTFTFSLIFLLIFILQENGQKYLVEDPDEKFLSKKTSILILFLLACTLHLMNALAVPLIVDSDTAAYLQGAVHLLQYGNLKGVSIFCGPGTTFLFAPILFLFGRNPWGMKILLHSFAIGSVLLSYRIGWQLSKKRRIAFCVGFLIMLIPDLYYYSNFIMSDMPNIFLMLLFSSLLLDALDDFRFPRILFALLVAGFATLLRAENILILLIGVFFLGARPTWNWLKGIKKEKNSAEKQANLKSLGALSLALLIALLPIIWLSYFNYEVHGFFGLNSSSGVVLYGGWIYYPEASGLAFQDESSTAVKEINKWVEEFPIEITDSSGVATPGEIYPSLIEAGYSTQEAFDIFEKAAWDSILSSKRLIPAVVKLKLRDAFRPEISHLKTFPLPDEKDQYENLYGDLYKEYFDPSYVSVPQLVRFQRNFYQFFEGPASGIYRMMVLFALFTVFLSFYKKPFIKWAALAFITALRIFIPNLMSVANWRYTVAGIPLLLIFGFIALATLFYGAKELLYKAKA